MKEICSSCRMTFDSENMETCGQCGSEFCYRCIDVHERETGHTKRPINKWTDDVIERAEEYLRLQFGKVFGYYMQSTWFTRNGNLILQVNFSERPHNKEVFEFKLTAAEIAAHPVLSKNAGAWGLGDALGELITARVVEKYGLTASGKRPSW